MTSQLDRQYSRRNDGGELAQRCHMLAGSVERWVERYRRNQPETVEKMVDEGLAADPELDPAEARRRAYDLYDRNWEADYRLKYEAEAKKLFAQAYEMGEIAKEHERLVLAPLAAEFEQVPQLFNEIADLRWIRQDPEPPTWAARRRFHFKVSFPPASPPPSERRVAG
jgi:hypothetical protein